RESEFVAVLGPSGSGKTTFLNILGGFDHADSGDIVVNGVSTKDYSDKDWDTYRNHRIGFIFQSYNLIPHQTVLANVELALTLAGVGRSERRERARAALERVGLGEHVDKRPAQLSGGQMQRVAIARALVNDPEIVLADEPTGALDTETGIQVMDILAEVARDRLVIMVTHNPQLAERYATRIVRIKDGRLVDDSNPIRPEELAAEQARAERDEGRLSKAPGRHASMGFLTALALSATNLMTKKGRTAMTAFAGSIGIIGIAAILALSNGVNGYIAKVEEDTLSSYPLQIARQSYDISSMLTGDGGEMPDGGDAASADASTASATTASGSAGVDLAQPIPESTMLKDMFASVKTNDLTSFKQFLDEGGDGITDEVNAIQYDYGVTPLVFRAPGSAATGVADDSPVQLSPNSVDTAMAGGASSGAMAGTMMTSTTAFSEMLDDQALLDQQYDVVAGRWASAPDEAVLVLTKSGKISDYTLYSIGALDPSQLSSLVDSTMSADGKLKVPETDVSFAYDDALGTTFKVLSPSDTYRKNDETGGWTDMSGDEDFMRQQVAGGLDLKIVGVVRPNGTSQASALTQGVAYTHGLAEELMARAAASPIVQQQLANPDVDVFTGKSFDELQSEAKKGVDLSSMFSVDEAALKGAFKLDTSKMGAGLDLSGFDFSGLDLSGMSIDLSHVTDGLDMASLISGAPAPDFTKIVDGLKTDPPLSADQLTQATKLGGQYVQGFLGYVAQNGKGLDPTAPDFGEKLAAALAAYAKTDAATAILDQVEKVAGKPVRERVQQIVDDYVTGQLAPYLTKTLQAVTQQVGDKIASAVSTQLQGQLTSAMQRTMGQLGPKISAQLAANMQSAFSFDPSAFANAIHFNMAAEDLTSLMTSYANASRLTYDNNLTTLGYAEESNPQSIKIYPKDFAAKERVLASIDGYNQRMTNAGQDDKSISYTDYMGVVMGSVTDIVNTISLVLIAFVSISLVVSSIMIGIITYISVLERKKEIGILRAMGASKLNVASVFNAETFIEGLIAGVFAIVVVVAVSVPVNAWVLAAKNVPNIMSLPVGSAVVLIGISVLLTVVAGLIPSAGASRRDPVEALRSE
uniref:ABC transporter ATP-binding protein/permease n=1 Tax=uncultured Parolsenella sp. TaxID=2083008 RepID=UPI0027D9A964